jgi:hypothetical protein
MVLDEREVVALCGSALVMRWKLSQHKRVRAL